MSVDFQVVFPVQAIPLTRAQIVPGTIPMLDVTGQDFRAVSEVLINGLESPAVTVVSQTRLLAQLPALVSPAQVSSVSVTSTVLTVGPKTLISFQVSPTPSKVSGILRLVQLFLKILFTVPGSDIFAPRVGGNGLKNLGRTFGNDQGGSIISDMTVAVSTTQRQILAIQSRDPTVPRNERLLSAVVSTATYDTAEGALIVGIELTSQAGRKAVANVML